MAAHPALARPGARRRFPNGLGVVSAAVQCFEQRQLLSGRGRVELTPADMASVAPGTNPIVPPLPTGLDLSQTFALASRPSATKTIFLDFNGHTTSNTSWNSDYTHGAAIVTRPYSIDWNSALSDIELTTIQCIWQRVAEDFAPFDINVTTIEPTTADLVRLGTGDERWGMRVDIGGSYNDWLHLAAGGIAVRNSFGQSQDRGVFVFTEHRLGEEKYTADCISHEVGHTLGLSHDGGKGMTYYSGHGSGETGWAPLMGASYNRALSQWSKGEYSNATNRQDDLKIITTGKGVNYRTDDYGSTLAGASALTFLSTDGDLRAVAVSGVIERNTDQDWFAFATTGGELAVDFRTASRGANLDLLAQLYNDRGELVAWSNPADKIDARIAVNLPAGLYYFMVDGVGTRGLSDGYSDYGSLGAYTISGTIAGSGADPEGLATDNGWIFGQVWHDADGDHVVDSTDGGLTGITVFLDSNKNGVFDPEFEQSTVTDDRGRYVFNALVAGDYEVRAVFPNGWLQNSPADGGSRLVTLAESGLVLGVDFTALNPPVLLDAATDVTCPVRAAATLVAANATVSDADTTSFAGVRLTVEWMSGAEQTDRLFVRSVGTSKYQIKVTKTTVSYSGRVIATITGGTGSVPLQITFNSAATLTVVEAVVRSLAYRSTTIRPTEWNKSLAIRLSEPTLVANALLVKQLQLVNPPR